MQPALLETEVYDQIRETARRFADDVVRPLAADLDRDETFPAEIYSQMGELGLFGITVRTTTVARVSTLSRTRL